MSRRYGQFCGLARALDVIGDRWNLLVVRQLLLGPARYRDLLDGLAGVATNLLADRLRDLEAAGVVERRLAAEGNAVRYALTPWGAALREPVEALIRWSAPLMTPGPGDDVVRGEWLVLALPALFAGTVVGGRPTTVGLAVGDELIQVRTTPSGVVADRHDGRELDVVVHSDAATILGLAAGALAVDETLRALHVEGDRDVAHALFAARPTRGATKPD